MTVISFKLGGATSVDAATEESRVRTGVISTRPRRRNSRQVEAKRKSGENDEKLLKSHFQSKTSGRRNRGEF